jgi:hypothetical protein
MSGHKKRCPIWQLPTHGTTPQSTISISRLFILISTAQLAAASPAAPAAGSHAHRSRSSSRTIACVCIENLCPPLRPGPLLLTLAHRRRLFRSTSTATRCQWRDTACVDHNNGLPGSVARSTSREQAVAHGRVTRTLGEGALCGGALALGSGKGLGLSQGF